jgi:hypothetical protein
MINGFIVMTNFPNHRYALAPFEDRDNNGVTHYRMARAYIQKYFQTFDIKKGFALLRSIRNRSEIYPTRCSLIFTPHAGEVYLCLENNFDRIWKLSINSQTIETYRGFQSHRRLTLYADGLLTAELLSRSLFSLGTF